jgi:hypothetical protein
MRLFWFVVLGGLVGSIAGARADAPPLEVIAAKKAAVLELLHRKAEKSLVTAAQDQNYRDYFSSHSAHHRHAIKRKIDEISLKVQKKFQVDEMCLIDPSGTEISRIVGDRVADDLSDEEAEAIFFQPGFEQQARQVYTSPVYMSPDTHRWVVAYVTPIVLDGEQRAILHYEHSLGVYQTALNQDLDGSGRFLLAVTEDGWIVSDSRRGIAIDRRDEVDAPAAYFDRFAPGGLSMAALRDTIGGDGRRSTGELLWQGRAYRVAYRVVGRWTLLVLENA